ncbi:hypothetical protein BKD09_18760 [Bradyrhizobium japonicum]|uniref:Uncharacterized protein n=1 Tax=Bradyrhizobium japonicum TaxID=375 RepID=A0A1L3FAR5_BRAJP|nr:hypothetical protein BKD09_18760 [Bradyrhizobium japonicum]
MEVAAKGRQLRRPYYFVASYPASHLDDLRPSEGGAAISYKARDSVVSAVLTFNAPGKIASLTCGRLNQGGYS